MNNQKVNPVRPKKAMVVAAPGAAAPVGAAPKRLRSATMAPQVNPANTRDYGKVSPVAASTPGFNLGGAI